MDDNTKDSSFNRYMTGVRDQVADMQQMTEDEKAVIKRYRAEKLLFFTALLAAKRVRPHPDIAALDMLVPPDGSELLEVQMTCMTKGALPMLAAMHNAWLKLGGDAVIILGNGETDVTEADMRQHLSGGSF